MKLVFKCHNKECQYYPCYAQCDKAFSDYGFGDDGNANEPTACIYNYEEPKWKLLHFPPMNNDFFDFAVDYVNGEGYSDVPEYLQDLLFCDGIRINRDDETIARAVKLFADVTDRGGYYADLDEVEKMLRKIDKMDLLKGVFPKGFVAGLAFGEALRQSNGEVLKKFIGSEEDY